MPRTPPRLPQGDAPSAAPTAHDETKPSSPRKRSNAKARTGPLPPPGVLERGIAILECFREDRLQLSLRELAELTGLDKATLLRLLGVLQRARMVHRFDSGSYAPGPALLHMGMLYRRTFDLGARLQPLLREVMELTGETTAFYVRSGEERVCLFRENTHKEVRRNRTRFGRARGWQDRGRRPPRMRRRR